MIDRFNGGNFDGWLREDDIEERILELYIFKRSYNSSLNFLINDKHVL